MQNDTSGHGAGTPRRAKGAWVRDAEEAILNVLNQQLAVPHPELEARLWQDGILLGGRKLRLAPHIISEATRALRSKGAITVEHRTPPQPPRAHRRTPCPSRPAKT